MGSKSWDMLTAVPRLLWHYARALWLFLRARRTIR